ncbi:hypothetical protein BDV96DRAFT_202087 [Lophiotrema nucula]|uniref:Uncharacterized protein n=1 Tax=Lophiotrema nucula TaxID=690887 RepID=A0A6A5YV70_9PLEO|nr:hypothetical protein BDV96DRAFT_202087 [Lophiotrema nucula]
MAANAPYFQLQRQFTDGTNAPFAPEDDEYDLSASIAPQSGSLFVNDPIQDHQSNSLEENHNLVELLEAATTAAGQATQAMNNEDRGSGQAAQGKGKRKRVSSPLDNANAGHGEGAVPSGRKRARTRAPTDPGLQDQQNSAQGSSDRKGLQPSNESLLVDARPAGVHSAAALFRRSSEKTTRKYTRPPMSKLFMSLQLTPENFLHLQSQAKTYMLDLEHPQRQDCVGNRGKGDTDMVKLRLFNCVSDFLADGVGEEFFGENVEKPGEKDTIEAARALGQDKAPSEGKLTWPRDGNKIISLVTPLLRRMVTNERQRMYAIETRKGGAKKKEASVEAAAGPTPEPDTGAPPQAQCPPSVQPLQTTFDSTSYPIAQDSIQSPHSHSASPVLSLPLGSSNMSVRYPDIPPLSSSSDEYNPLRGDIRMQRMPTRSVPPQNTYDLHSIRINLAKNGIRLRTHRKLKCPERTFRDYSLEQLFVYIKLLIRNCQDEYPELRDQSSTDELSAQMKGKAEALRGLAVAATEMNSNSNDGVDGNADLVEGTRFDSVAIPPTTYPTESAVVTNVTGISPPTLALTTNFRPRHSSNPLRGSSPFFGEQEDPDTAGAMLGVAGPRQNKAPRFYGASENASTEALAPRSPQSPHGTPAPFTHDDSPTAFTRPPKPLLLSEPGWPKITIKVITETGLKSITNAQDWATVKDEIAYAPWAGGSMSMLVELV